MLRTLCVASRLPRLGAAPAALRKGPGDVLPEDKRQHRAHLCQGSDLRRLRRPRRAATGAPASSSAAALPGAGLRSACRVVPVAALRRINIHRLSIHRLQRDGLHRGALGHVALGLGSERQELLDGRRHARLRALPVPAPGHDATRVLLHQLLRDRHDQAIQHSRGFGCAREYDPAELYSGHVLAAGGLRCLQRRQTWLGLLRAQPKARLDAHAR